MNSNETWHYDAVAVTLHWLIAILLVTLIGLGWYMGSIENQPNSGWYFNLHKSLGILTGSLIVIRLLWRFGHHPAELPLSVPRWQAKCALATHWLLYVCIVLMPLTGFIGASLSKHGVAFFGLRIPSWVHPNHDLSEQFFQIHSTVVWILIALIVLHVLAAFKHLLYNKDQVFQRMWFK